MLPQPLGTRDDDAASDSLPDKVARDTVAHCDGDTVTLGEGEWVVGNVPAGVGERIMDVEPQGEGVTVVLNNVGVSDALELSDAEPLRARIGVADTVTDVELHCDADARVVSEGASDAVAHADGKSDVLAVRLWLAVVLKEPHGDTVGDADTMAVGEMLGVPPPTDAVDVAELDARAEAVKE